MKIMFSVRCKMLWVFIGLLGMLTSVKADSITNDFDSSLDYLANGVAGTMWDGIYVAFGDVPGGIVGPYTGATVQANETSNPGFLTVQSTGTSWAGAEDDGFYLFKVVAGDFDVSVENVEPFDNTPDHFGGLLVRAFTTNGPAWGAPFSTTDTNASENWLNITRFNEFSVGDQIRYATNATDIQISASYNSGLTNYNGETTDNRYLRITRVGNIFNFYDKTNQSDAWVFETNVTRLDLAGIPMQVGIEDAAFSTSSPLTYYTDFELTGTNVNAAIVPPANPTGLTASITSSNALTFSWTPGAGSSGSIVLIRQNNPLVLDDKPINGYSYNAITNFEGGDNLGGNIYAVYVGAASSATITGLGSIVDTNYVAVYSYKGSGASIVYGASPAQTLATGAEPIVSVSLSLFPTNIPVNGVAVAQVTVTYGDGSTTINPTGATLTSANEAVATGTSTSVSGLSVGTTVITSAYAGFSGTDSVAVTIPAYTNGFDLPHNFLTGGLPGSTWDGVYLKAGDVANATYSGPAVDTTAFDADISSNNVLTMTAANSAWQGASDNGPFIFKNVPGDFEASVHITDYSILNYEFVGLQARAYNATDNSSPSGPGYAENFVDWLRFDEYGISTTTFNTENGNNAETDNTDSDTTDYWLLMSRVNGTNFYFFKKASLTDPWILTQTIERSDLTNGVPLQVGLEQSMFTGTFGSVQFDNFSLDATNIAGGVPPSATTNLAMAYDTTNDTMTLTWVPGTNSDGSASTSFVVMRQGSPVSAQPYFGILTTSDPVFGQGTDLGSGNYVVYRGVENTVTVSGLTAGAVYYAAVYGYSGSSTTKSFNEADSADSSTQAGSFIGISASLAGEIPVGGIGLPVVLGLVRGGGTVNVSSSVLLTSGNTNIIVATNGILTGLAIGSTTNTVTFISGTNTFVTNLVATVRAPGFTDNFSVSHDYIANGVTNTSWSGVYAYSKFTIPDTTFVSDPVANVFSVDANITSNDVLTVTSENVGWENAQDDGFFLFKYAPADFQVAVHITTPLLDGSGNVIASYNYPGLLARPYSVDASGNAGAPLYTTNGDSFVTWARFDEFGIGTRAELIITNITNPSEPSSDVGDGQLWLLMVRKNSTNFFFYQKANATDPWLPAPAGQQFSVTNFAGVPMQVGIMEGGFDSGTVVTGQFDSFMLDETAAVVSPVVTVKISGGNINLSWPASGSYTLQYTLSLSPTNWQPVATSPVTVNGNNIVTLPATNRASFFRLIQ